MGQAKSLCIRQEVILLKKAGRTNAQIAESLSLGLGTVKNLWKRYKSEGESGLSTLYSRCGRRYDANGEIAFRLVRLLKHLHPSWGVPLIIVKIGEKYPQIQLRSARQYQRRLFKGSGKLPPPILPPAIVLDRARIAHDTWQIDAKERFSLLDGKEVCYLTISDEGTGAVLAARAFPPWADRTGSTGTDSGISARTVQPLDDAQGH